MFKEGQTSKEWIEEVMSNLNEELERVSFVLEELTEEKQRLSKRVGYLGGDIEYGLHLARQEAVVETVERLRESGRYTAEIHCDIEGHDVPEDSGSSTCVRCGVEQIQVEES